DTSNEWIEMRLRARSAQLVHVDALALDVSFAPGEEMRTEVSAKFRSAVVERELRDARMELERWWTDAGGDFAVSLSGSARVHPTRSGGRRAPEASARLHPSPRPRGGRP